MIEQIIFTSAATFYNKVAVLRSVTNLNIINSTIMNEGLRDVLIPIGVLATIGTAVVLFTRTLTDYILKKKMIEKGFVNDDTQAIFKRHVEDNKYSSLKWGLLVFFAGISLVIMEYIPTTPESPLPYGLFSISVSLGFLIYYFIVKKELEK